MSNSIDTDTLTSLGLSRQPESSTPKRLGQDEFMALMVAQLRNQDPFSPMKSGEFLGQIAQFGTVSGIDDVRGALDNLSSTMAANQTMQAAALVDRTAYVPAREAWLPPGGAIQGTVEVPPGTGSATVGIYDLNGRLVASQSVDVSGETAGEFVWDGSLPDGTEAPDGYYELRATGDVGGASTALDVLVAGRVESVSLQNANGAIELTITGLGRVDLSTVKRLS